MNCNASAEWRAATQANTAQSANAPISPFGVQETGWAVYAPLIGREISSACAGTTPAFAAAVSRWQAGHAVAANGIVDGPTLKALGAVWLLRRPFVRASRSGCPAAATALAPATQAESYGGKAILARPAALEAYRRMIAAARTASIAPPLLQIASAYRGPDEEAARCAGGGCGDARKAHCSAHRTGLAFDFDLGAAPGSDPFSTDDVNRLYQSRTIAYRWLVANADRFGFLPYPFEPWHWEWTGEPV